MEVSTEQFRRCDLVTVKGRIDINTVKELSAALATIKEAGRYNIAINMKDVTFISSAGLSELIDTQKACKHLKRGRLVLVEISTRVREVLELAGLTSLFEIYETDKAAIGSF